MTKVLSFTEWLGQQDSTEVDYAQSECDKEEANSCAYRDEPTCLSELIASCPLRRLYETQKAQDLKKWEKWNRQNA